MRQNDEGIRSVLEAGFTGKGRKIIIWDNYAPWEINEQIENHPDCVAKGYRMDRPDANIRIFDFNGDNEQTMEDMLKFADGKMCVVNISMIGINLDLFHEFKKQRDDPNKDIYERFHSQLFVVAATGNTGKEEYKYPAASLTFKDKCYAVGALHEEGLNDVFVPGYSTYHNRVDGADITGYDTKYGPFYGTSGAAPKFGAKVDMFLEMYNYIHGHDPTIPEINTWIADHCMAIDDSRAGQGLLIMEVLKVKHEVKMKIPYKGKRHVKQIQYLDSAVTYTDNKTGKAIGQDYKDSEGKNGRPMIITHEGTDQNGDGLLDKDVPDTMFMPARMLGETLGYDVIWDDNTDTVTFRSKGDIVPIRRV